MIFVSGQWFFAIDEQREYSRFQVEASWFVESVVFGGDSIIDAIDEKINPIDEKFIPRRV
jgi:hypothetical protein